jgi:hypothetical protein
LGAGSEPKIGKGPVLSKEIRSESMLPQRIGNERARLMSVRRRVSSSGLSREFSVKFDKVSCIGKRKRAQRRMGLPVVIALIGFPRHGSKFRGRFNLKHGAASKSQLDGSLNISLK